MYSTKSTGALPPRSERLYGEIFLSVLQQYEDRRSESNVKVFFCPALPNIRQGIISFEGYCPDSNSVKYAHWQNDTDWKYRKTQGYSIRPMNHTDRRKIKSWSLR
jgi:hypothetical protein